MTMMFFENSRNNPLITSPEIKLIDTASAAIFVASIMRFAPMYWATTVDAPVPITPSSKMAIWIYWLAVPTPATASSDTALSMNVSASPININKKNSKNIGQVK